MNFFAKSSRMKSNELEQSFSKTLMKRFVLVSFLDLMKLFVCFKMEKGVQLDEIKIQKLETFVQYLLPRLVFDVHTKKAEPPKQHTVAQHYQSYQASSQIFPSIEEIITIGSRAEETNLDSKSDLDRLYVIGPGLAEDKGNDTYLSWMASFFTSETTPKFYWSKTENSGYYTLQDAKGNFIYPSDIHVKLGGGLNVLTQGQPKAALPEVVQGNSKRFRSIPKKDEEDKVPSMRLKEWPQEILENMEGKLDWCENLKDELKGIFFVLSLASAEVILMAFFSFS